MLSMQLRERKKELVWKFAKKVRTNYGARVTTVKPQLLPPFNVTTPAEMRLRHRQW
jgi:hypothetical protein